MRKNLVRLLIQGKLKGEELAPFLVEPENRPEGKHLDCYRCLKDNF